MRNITKTTENAIKEIPTEYNLTIGEIAELINMANHGIQGKYDAIVKAFQYGFILGNRATLRKKLKRL